MQTVLFLTPKEARDYFMSAEQYCGIALPSYINFQPILDYVKTSIGTRELANCLKEEKQYPSKFDEVNYKILVNKDGKYAYRPIQIANPYLYYLLVKSITTKDNWEALQKRFEEFKDSHIEFLVSLRLKTKRINLHLRPLYQIGGVILNSAL